MQQHEAIRIAAKWVLRLGAGFNPDTPGADYVPALSDDEIVSYDSDMDRLFGLSDDPCEPAMKVMALFGYAPHDA